MAGKDTAGEKDNIFPPYPYPSHSPSIARPSPVPSLRIDRPATATMASDELQATLSAAIQSARYNEAVVVTVNNDDCSSSNEIVLVACLDQENGGIIWKNCAAVDGDGAGGGAGDGDGDGDGDDVSATAAAAVSKCGSNKFRDDPGIVRHLRTKRWALPMLNDHRRNSLYEIAIRQATLEMCKRRAIEHANKSNVDSNINDETTIRILDIGSGTGLLAMMGAKYVDDAQQFIAEPEHKQNVHVTSVEMASAMARLARMTIEENGMSDKISVVEHHSTDSDFQMDDTRFVQNTAVNSTPPLHEDTNPTTNSAKRVKVGVEENPNEKADICTSELLESGLLGEGVLPSIRDAWERHLKSDAIVIPQRARVYAVLIEGLPIITTSTDGAANNHADTTVNAATAFFGPELHAFHKASGGVWLSTVASSPTNANRGALLGSSHDEVGGVTIPLHANAMLHKDYNGDFSGNDIAGISRGDYRRIRPLTAPIEVLDFVFSDKDALPPPSGRSTIKDVYPTADGTCDGVLFWWELDSDSTYSTIPIGYLDIEAEKPIGCTDESHWQDHWQQVLFVFGDGHLSESAGRMRKLRVGQPVELVTSHNDESISFSITTTPTMNPSESFAGIESRQLDERHGTIMNPLINQHISTTRALQLNDSSRTSTLRAAIQYCIDTTGRDAPLLDVSDMGLCAMIASVLGARKVTSLESSSGSLPRVAATVAQIGNGLPQSNAGFQIIQAQTEHLLSEHILGGAAEIVFAEPYYEMLEGWHLQEALNYCYTVCSLKKRGVVSSTALSVPAYANVMVCVVECDQFCTAYGHVGSSTTNIVAGFKHSTVNHFGNRYHEYDVSLPLWQYRYKPLSKPTCVARIPYEGTNPTIESTGGASEITATGHAQAVVIWVDYACRTNKTSHQDKTEENFDIISTASSSHRQLIRKMSQPFAINEDDVKAGAKFYCRASFGKISDGIEDHSFTFDIRPSSS